MALLGIPDGAFVWGRGGQRVTPDQIAQQEALAQRQRMAGMDFSPVGSVWEGLGRVASGFLGGQRMRRADAEAARNAEETQDIIAGLLAEPVEGEDRSQTIAAALSNPYIDDSARQIALQQYELSNAAWEPANDFERALFASGVQPGSPEWQSAMQTKVANTLDPFTNLVVGGNSITGRQSLVQQALQRGGGPASTGPQPGMIEDGYRFLGGDPADQSNWEQVMSDQQGGQALSAASQSQTITPEQAAQVRQSLGPNGQAAFEQWMRENNITIGGM